MLRLMGAAGHTAQTRNNNPPRAVIFKYNASVNTVYFYSVEVDGSAATARGSLNLSGYSFSNGVGLGGYVWTGKEFLASFVEAGLSSPFGWVVCRSVDGLSWSVVLSGTTSALIFTAKLAGLGRGQVHFELGDVGGNYKYYRSTDGGISWGSAQTRTLGAGNTNLCITPQNEIVTTGTNYSTPVVKLPRSGENTELDRFPASGNENDMITIIYWKKFGIFVSADGSNAYSLDKSFTTKNLLSSVGSIAYPCVGSTNGLFTGDKLWVVDSSGGTIYSYYSINGSSFVSGPSWAGQSFYGRSSQSRGRVGIGSSDILGGGTGNVFISWDNGATFKTINVGSAYDATVCV